MKRKPKKKRITLPLKIRTAATVDEAIQVALRGRTLSDIERAADQYLFFSNDNAAERLLGLVLDAIDRRDRKTLVSLADFVGKWQKWKPSEHKLLAHILSLKSILLQGNRTMTRKKLCELVRFDGDPSQLGKLGKKYGFPFPKRKAAL